MTGRMALICGLILFICGGCTLTWFLSTENVEVTVQAPPSGEARSNPYHASELFLSEIGIETETVWSPPKDLGPETGLLVLLSPDRLPLPRRDEALLAWAEAGGHLVVVPRRGEDSTQETDDPLMRPFKVEIDGPDWIRGTGVKTDPFGIGAAPNSTPSPSLEPAADGRLRVAFEGPYLVYRTEDEPYSSWSYDDSRGTRAFGFTHGQGLVTFLADAEMWSNDSLRTQDNARFLQQVARLRPSPTQAPPTRAYLVRGDEPPSLLGLLWALAWPLCVTLLIWLVVWVFQRTRRFGPILPAPPVSRRRLGEHLEAAGRFLWRHRGQLSLIEPVRDSLLDTIRRRRPDLVSLRQGAQVEALAELIRVHPAEVEDALYGPPPRNPDRFTRAVTLLERLRRSL